MELFQGLNTRGTRRLLGFVVIIFILFAAYQIVLSLHFRVTNTNPGTGDVATVAPFIEINFNRQLTSKNLSVISSYSVVKSYKVQDKTLFLNLKNPMTAGYKYWITVKGITDTKGETIQDKTISFTPKYISAQKLPADQQQALLQQQAIQNRTPSVGNVSFSGINSLIGVGLSNTQANSLQQYLFSFNQKAKDISISNVAAVPHNPTSQSTLDTINFSVRIDSTPYTATINYDLASNFIQLFLYNSSGAQVYQSGASS